MDAELDGSEMEKSVAFDDSSVLNDATNNNENDSTLTQDQSFTMLSNSVTNETVEGTVEGNPADEIHDYTFNKKAIDIVDDAIESASFSIRSSGDFSMLNDSRSLLKNKSDEISAKAHNEPHETDFIAEKSELTGQKPKEAEEVSALTETVESPKNENYSLPEVVQFLEAQDKSLLEQVESVEEIVTLPEPDESPGDEVSSLAEVGQSPEGEENVSLKEQVASSEEVHSFPEIVQSLDEKNKSLADVVAFSEEAKTVEAPEEVVSPETLECLEQNVDTSSQKVEDSSQTSVSVAEEPQEQWLDILGNGLLRKKVIKPGDGREYRPERGQEVTVKMESLLEDGTILQESNSIKFIVADGDVPESLDMSVNLMEKNEVSVVESDVKYCKPKDGLAINLPQQGKITYNIELLDVEDGPYNISVAIQKRLTWVDEKRQLGNDLYSKNMLEEAKLAYTKCNRVLQQAANEEHDENRKKEIEEYTMKCHNNLAATFMKLNNWKEALKACQVAEKIDGNNTKTLFRKGKVCAKLGQYKQSIVALKKAVSLNPDDKAIQNELSKQQKRLSDQNKAQKIMYQRMLGGVAKKMEKERENNQKSWFSGSKMMIGGSLLVLGTAVLFGVYLMHR